MLKRLSISLRLTVWYACISALGLTIFGIVMWFVLESSMLSWKDRTLQMRASRAEAALYSTANDPAALNRRLEDVVSVLPEGEWITVVSTGGRVFFPAGRETMSLAGSTPCAAPLYRDRVVRRERFRELCRPVTYAGHAAFLIVPSPLSEDRILLSTFLSGLCRMIPILLLVSGTGGYILSRRALAPVDVVIEEARSITADDLSKRLTVSAADDQLRRLAMEWNNLLSRIEKAMTRVSQFTADASHELRSPIAFIRATAEFQLGNSSLDEELRDAFRTIVDETTMTTELLENLLLLARAEVEETVAPVQPVDVCAITGELVLRFGPAARKLHQELVVDASAGPVPMLRMSAGHLRRVLTAILENAIKYTPEGGRICIEYLTGQSFCLRVSDTGVGIAPEHLDRVFDRFFRVDQARTSMNDGVGLGLPIARQLMEQYGGSISVQSQLRLGTSVTLTFPELLLSRSHAGS